MQKCKIAMLCIRIFLCFFSLQCQRFVLCIWKSWYTIHGCDFYLDILCKHYHWHWPMAYVIGHFRNDCFKQKSDSLLTANSAAIITLTIHILLVGWMERIGLLPEVSGCFSNTYLKINSLVMVSLYNEWAEFGRTLCYLVLIWILAITKRIYYVCRVCIKERPEKRW